MEINEIIKDEYLNMVNESLVMEDDRLKFSEPIKKATYYNYENFSNDYDVEIGESNLLLNWRVSFWVNDMGIENLIIQGDSVEGMFKVMLHDKQTDEVVQEIDKNIADTPWKFVVLDEPIIKKGSSLYVESLIFDFKTKTCQLTFTSYHQY